MKAGRSSFRLRLRVPGPRWWIGGSIILGGGLSRSMRRRIRRLGVSRLPTRLCVRGGGRVAVRRDLSEVDKTSFR